MTNKVHLVHNSGILDILYRFLIPISHVAWSPIKCNTSLILKIDIRVGLSTNDVASDVLYRRVDNFVARFLSEIATGPPRSSRIIKEIMIVFLYLLYSLRQLQSCCKD